MPWAGVVLERLAERPQLLVLTVRIDDDLLDQVIDGAAFRLDPTRGCAGAVDGERLGAVYHHPVALRLELVADLNAQDDDGHGWSTLGDATDPDAVRPGAVLVAGNRHAHARVRILGVDADGQVHFEIL